MKHIEVENGGPALTVVPDIERETPTPLESHLARLEFAEALGRRAVQADPALFDRSLVGRWQSVEQFVDGFIIDAGVQADLEAVSAPLRPFVSIDRLKVLEELQRELLVVPVGERVWVFDPPHVVNSTVAEPQQQAHIGQQDD